MPYPGLNLAHGTHLFTPNCAFPKLGLVPPAPVRFFLQLTMTALKEFLIAYPLIFQNHFNIDKEKFSANIA